MRRVILPTSQIVRELHQYDPLFCFYSEGDGLLGLVRDTVLLKPQRLEDMGLMERVLFEYERSVEMRMLENMFSRHNYAAAMVELVVEEVDRAVTEMLQQFFRSLAFDLCKSRYIWVGSDLLVTAEVLS